MGVDELSVDLPLPSLAYAQYLAPLGPAREPEGQASDLETIAAMEAYLAPPPEEWLGTKVDLLA